MSKNWLKSLSIQKKTIARDHISSLYEPLLRNFKLQLFVGLLVY